MGENGIMMTTSSPAVILCPVSSVGGPSSAGSASASAATAAATTTTTTTSAAGLFTTGATSLQQSGIKMEPNGLNNNNGSALNHNNNIINNNNATICNNSNSNVCGVGGSGLSNISSNNNNTGLQQQMTIGTTVVPTSPTPTSMMNTLNSVLNGANQQSGSSPSSSSSAAAAAQSLLAVQSTADYLAQLLKDKKQLAAFPNVFLHIERLLDEEINRVRGTLFQINGVEKKPLVLPDPDGPIVQKQEKVYVPIKDHPDYNFVGRILGPRGMTAKQLEQETGCKIMVRGRGSMRDKKKEEQNRGKPNWEHLNDDLHVLITVEDTSNRAIAKIQRAVEEIQKLLVPVTDGEDELKKRQLMELAIINGTYRDSSAKNFSPTSLYELGLEAEHMKQLLGPQMTLHTTSLRTPTATPLGAPLIISPRHIHVPTSAALLNGSGPPPLMTPAEAGLLYASPYDFHQYAALAASPHLLTEYQPVTTTSSADTLTTSVSSQYQDEVEEDDDDQDDDYDETVHHDGNGDEYHHFSDGHYWRFHYRQ